MQGCSSDLSCSSWLRLDGFLTTERQMLFALQQGTAAACQTPVTTVVPVWSVGTPSLVSARRAGKDPRVPRVSQLCLNFSECFMMRT